MSRHEDLMAAARAGYVAAQELGLPPEDPQRGVDRERDVHLDRLQRDYQQEREANIAMRKAVIAYGNKITLLVRSVIALGLAVTVAGGLILARQAELGKRARETQFDGAKQARVVIGQTCERQNLTLRALRTIIERGDRNIIAFYREGTITRAQYERALKASLSARRDLKDGDCAYLSRLIPIPDATP